MPQMHAPIQTQTPMLQAHLLRETLEKMCCLQALLALSRSVPIMSIDNQCFLRRQELDYALRGEQLKDLSFYEWVAIISVVPEPKPKSKPRNVNRTDTRDSINKTKTNNSRTSALQSNTATMETDKFEDGHRNEEEELEEIESDGKRRSKRW